MNTIKCPLCGETTVKQDFDFWRCLKCRCEVWPADDKPVDNKQTEDNPEKKKGEITTQDILEVYSDSMKQGERKGGSKKGRGSAKKKTASLYAASYKMI